MKQTHVYQLELKGTPWFCCNGVQTVRSSTVFLSRGRADEVIPRAIQKSIDDQILLPEEPGQAMPIECKIIELEIVD